MKLRSLELSNFRKFRDPIRITGVGDGLNIVVEANEAGKSTLLEALRAAFFLRYLSRSGPVKALCPFGDAVAPQVGVTFDVGSERWTLAKRFLKTPFMRLAGPGGRFEGDEGEERLQTLLRFERAGSRGVEDEACGALGLLWVTQASALAVTAPGKLVRENVRAALESEVGVMVGGRRFETVKARIEAAYAELMTPTGRFRGPLAEAEKAARQAKARRETAESALKTFEDALTELDQKRRAYQALKRDMDDPERAAELRKLNADLLEAGRAGARLREAEANCREAERSADLSKQALEDLAAAGVEVKALQSELAAMDKQLEARSKDAEAAQAACAEAEAEHARSRDAANRAEAALDVAREDARRSLAFEAAERALKAFAEATRLEAELADKTALARRDASDEALRRLEDLERAVIRAEAALKAGSVRVDVELKGRHLLRVDGEPFPAGAFSFSRPTEIAIGDVARLVVRPSEAAARPLETDLAAARQALAEALAPFRTASVAEALGVARAARAAKDQIRFLKRQIDALCPGERSLGLNAGPAAYKAMRERLEEIYEARLGVAAPETAGEGAPETAGEAAGKGGEALEARMACEARMAREARGLREAALAADVRASERRARRDAAQKSFTEAQYLRAHAHAALENARSKLTRLLEAGDQAALQDRRDRDLQALARRTTELETARAVAAALDAEKIQKKIDDRVAAERAEQAEAGQLAQKIARLEERVATDGPKGLTGEVEAARELDEALVTAFEALKREAEALALLRRTLAVAERDASRAFLAPVTRRAARYVERILPGAGLSFDGDMGLSAIERAGVDERCGDLSKGTQEQLAVLTRLAFADLLRDRGEPVSLILDDPLVYSDDLRLETMTEILEEAAQRMQIILLTCRAKAFRHVRANRVVWEKA